MKKLLALILATFMMVAMFAACGDEAKEETKTETKEEAKEVNSIEPELKAAAENAFRDALEASMPIDEFEGAEKEELQKLLDKFADAQIKNMEIEVSDVEVDGDTATAKVTGKKVDDAEASELLSEKASAVDEPETEFEQAKVLLEIMIEVVNEVDFSEDKEATGEFEKDGDEWVMTNPEIFND